MKPTPTLLDFIGHADYDEASLLHTLLADPATAKLLVAWRHSVQSLEETQAAAATADQDDLLRWLDDGWSGCVNMRLDEP